MNSRLLLILISALTVCVSFAAPAPAQAVWKAGVATAVITPEQAMWMAGYASRTNVSQGKFQDLHAKALALEDERGGRMVFVTLDLIGVPRTLRKSLEARAQKAWQSPPESLLLNASHTHSGPEFRFGRAPADDGDFKPSTLGDNYGRDLEEKLLKLIGTALETRTPARLAYSFARCGVAMNRRLPTKTGYQNSPYPEGPVDQSVPVLRVEGADGKLRAVLFGYACHNTTLALYQFSGDYAGYAQQYFEADHPGVTALFMLGCGGDQNPYPRGTVELAQKHGRALATAVEAALATTLKSLSGPLRSAYAEIQIDYAPAPTRDEFKARLDSKDKYESSHAKRMLERLDKGEKLPTLYPYPVQVVQFGDALTFVALGGEVVVDFSLRLKKELVGPAVWVAGYSNDVMAYIPSLRVMKEGGYEAGGAMRFSTTHPGPWAESTEERIVSKVHELNRKLLK
ncbi:MAG: neutral/alkaline non-lysosomal ceramidase N-terminal domain-containing protein [Verrucomicrobia bacterium]|nr:neutral/alkaline non-lysosomal ceramidase N-terminal domain-containing protein [Verrucomicrobiota bacterium]